ncbi:hypothetical protein K443DRAFT_35265, partial [Laccaria amethystina LaAM-08-1]
MAQMEAQHVRTVHDAPPRQWGGHRVGLKHHQQWFVLQDAQRRWRRRKEQTEERGLLTISRHLEHRL